jgi:Dyp-type peroxidase family
MAPLDPKNLDLTDVQGYILRGYRMDLTRHFVLQITDVAGARQLLGALVEHEPALHAQVVNRQPDTLPQITTATDWGETKPDYCLNIGLTAAGLDVLHAATDGAFPAEFIAGAAARKVVVGDTEKSDPQHWIGKLDPASAQHVHIVLSLYALSSAILERTTATLRSLFSQNNALAELWCFDAQALESYQHVPRSCEEHDPSAFPKVHFGYTDGIAQPTIDAAPPTLIPDAQPVVPLGEFLLGYPSEVSSSGYAVPQPPALGQNGSFAAFLVLQQDVDGFEDLLVKNESPSLSKELLAAKICGRWRNGVPLALSPGTDTPDPPVTLDTINKFGYADTDRKGFSCPIGSHIRRTNPRDEIVQGDVEIRRIVRRAMPYGPPYDPAQPNDGLERGLVGLFINASIADQFEFLMQNWVNDSQFAAGLKKPDGTATREVMIGNNGSNTGYFIIPNASTPQQPTVITGFSSFVTTRGMAYLFLPSITALRYLADAKNFTSTPD